MDLRLRLAVLLVLALVACRPSEKGAGSSLEPADTQADRSGHVESVKETDGAEAIEADLELGTEIERRIAPGEKHHYLLALKPDDFLDLKVEQLGVDVAVRLRDPSGELVLEMDQPIADLGLEPLLAVAKEDGSYELEVEVYPGETSEGSYRVGFQITHPARDIDRLRAQAMTVFYSGEQLFWRRKADAAIERYEAALEIWRKAGDEFWQATTLDRVGRTHAWRRHWRPAVAAWQEAAELFRNLGECRLEAISRSGAGAALFELAEFERASEQHLQALELRRQVGDERGAGIVLFSLGEISRIQGETQKALDEFSQALANLDRPEDRQYRGPPLHSLGNLYYTSGKLQLAMDHFREAEQIYAEFGVLRNQASALSRCGQLTFELGDAGQARKILGRSLALRRQAEDPRGEAVDLSRIGEIERTLGRKETAEGRYIEALDLLDDLESPRMTARVLVRLGSLYQELHRVEESLGCYREALAIFEEAGDVAGQAAGLLGVAIGERRLGHLEAARRAGEQALAIAEVLRAKPFSESLRFSFFSTAQQYFEFYIDLLMELHVSQPAAGHAAEALKASERSRARSLLDLLGEATAEIRGDAAPELLAQEQALQYRLNAAVEPIEAGERPMEAEGASKRVREIVERLDTVRAEIRRRSPRYADLTQPQPLTLDEIQEVLDPETLLLEYKLSSERSFLWLVGHESFFSVELAPGTEIERSVHRVHELLRKGDHPESEVLIPRLLCDLSAKLLQAVAGRLGRKRLVIVADGALQYLPFAALPDPDSELPCDSAPPLVAIHEIVHLPSASTLAILRREGGSRRPPAGLVAMLADPVFASDDERVPPTGRSSDSKPARPLRRLRYSHQEAESILRLVKAERRYLAVGFDASKETVLSGRLADYRIVHFGTHGVMDPLHPETSGIALSMVNRQGEPIDGWLRAHEIYNLRLPVDLVVLGACETALGREVKGEGLVGLARGFMYAGASRVIVSLWRVGDRGTAELMEAFYSALLEQDMPPAGALRAAQLAVLEKHPHPYHWAGFMLQGEWK